MQIGCRRESINIECYLSGIGHICFQFDVDFFFFFFDLLPEHEHYKFLGIQISTHIITVI